MLGIPAGGLSVATVCKRIAAVVGELLFSRNWFEISGGAAAAAAVAATAVFQKVSFYLSIHLFYLSVQLVSHIIVSYIREISS